jgi:hypothetical protein
MLDALLGLVSLLPNEPEGGPSCRLLPRCRAAAPPLPKSSNPFASPMTHRLFEVSLLPLKKSLEDRLTQANVRLQVAQEQLKAVG